jgi:hypothetical protein
MVKKNYYISNARYFETYINVSNEIRKLKYVGDVTPDVENIEESINMNLLSVNEELD